MMNMMIYNIILYIYNIFHIITKNNIQINMRQNNTYQHPQHHPLPSTQSQINQFQPQQSQQSQQFQQSQQSQSQLNKSQQSQQSQQKPQQQPQPSKQNNSLQQISIIKRAKISNYPYYPVTYTLTQNQLSYVFSLDFNVQQISLCITPFKQNKQKNVWAQFSNTFISLQALPKKNINYLYVLEYEDYVNINGRSVTAKMIDFVVGFSFGFLLRCKYTNAVKPQVAGSDKRQFSIIGKFNKKPTPSQGMLMRMSNAFFGSDQFYKTAVEKPVRSFICHRDRFPTKTPNTQKYNYSYLIGNHLYLCTQFTQQTQSQTLRLFSQVPWQTMNIDTMAKLNNKQNSLIINSKRHKTLISSSSILIQWAQQIPTYIYTKNNQIIVADNEQNKILIYDVIDNLKIKKIFKFDLDVKKMTYCSTRINGKQQTLLLIMPYDTNLYILNLTQGLIASFRAHRSYVTQAVLNNNGYIITGGCDHRIGLTNINTVKHWGKVQEFKPMANSESGTKLYTILTQNMPVNKMGDIYFLGEFNNVNSERNNNNDYGFGNFITFGDGCPLYAFLTFDFFVKVYRISV